MRVEERDRRFEELQNQMMNAPEEIPEVEEEIIEDSLPLEVPEPEEEIVEEPPKEEVPEPEEKIPEKEENKKDSEEEPKKKTDKQVSLFSF